MTAGGVYDGLEIPREAGDVAVTEFREGRWWYPTVYRDADSSVKGTYVNICTPVELFPSRAVYLDLHVDVVRYPDGETRRLDDDELDAAEEAGLVSGALASKARSVTDAVLAGLE
jgi:predicted RNA-binding protein associated with RNAse of E/G family